jgi:hypothetical protein
MSCNNNQHFFLLLLILQILMLGEGFSRRNRFIVSCALAFGMGVSMVPQWSKNALWPDLGPGAHPSLQSVRTAVLLILDTGFCVGAIVAFVLNMIVPHEENTPEVGVSNMLHNKLSCCWGILVLCDARLALVFAPQRGQQHRHLTISKVIQLATHSTSWCSSSSRHTSAAAPEPLHKF